MAEELYLKIYDPVTVTGAEDELFLIPDASDIFDLRLWVHNSGGTALSAARFEGSFDGLVWVAIDAAAVTTAFGTLAGAGRGSLYVTNLYFPYLRMMATSAGTTTVSAAITLGRRPGGLG